MPSAPLEWLSAQPCERLVRGLGSEDRARREAALRDVGNALRGMTMPSDPDDANSVYQGAIMGATAMRTLMETGRGTITPAEATDLDTACAIRTFLSQGRQTFRFANSLAEELAQTDVRDVSLSEIAFPYDAFVMEFGAHAPLADGTMVEGVLVERRGNRVRPVVLLRPFTRTPKGPVFLSLGMLPLPEGDEDEDVGQALDRALGMYETMSAITLTGPASGRSMDEPWVVESEQAHRAEMTAGNGILRDLLPIIVNGLLYVDNCRSGMRRVWDPAAPTDLVDKVEEQRPGARKAEQRLRAAGWTRIHLCELEEDGETGSAPAAAGRNGPRAHWRRGHWRRQPHGPGGALRRRIRIRPMRVGSGGGAGREGYATA